MTSATLPKPAGLYRANIKPAQIIVWTLLLIGGLIMITPLLL